MLLEREVIWLPRERPNSSTSSDDGASKSAFGGYRGVEPAVAVGAGAAQDHRHPSQDHSTGGGAPQDQAPTAGSVGISTPGGGALRIIGLRGVLSRSQGCKGWHSRSERQNRCNTDQRPEVGAIRIMSAGTGAIRITSAEIGAIDIMKPSRAQSRALDRSLMRVLSLMRLSLGGGAGLAIGAARALGAAEDGSRDGGRSIRRRPRAQRAPCLP